MRPLDFDLLGCPVSDYATGRTLGRVKCVVLDQPPQRIARIAVEFGLEVEDAEQETLYCDVEPLEPRPHQDYMVGQTSTVSLHDLTGHPIVRAGETITPQVLDHARRAGLLHRLEATF